MSVPSDVDSPEIHGNHLQNEAAMSNYHTTLPSPMGQGREQQASSGFADGPQ